MNTTTMLAVDTTTNAATEFTMAGAAHNAPPAFKTKREGNKLIRYELVYSYCLNREEEPA